MPLIHSLVREALIKSFDKLRMNGNILIPFVVSLSNHERNQFVQHFLRGKHRPRMVGVCGLILALSFVQATGHSHGASEGSVASATKSEESLIQLGRMLFSDTRLSRDNTISCASCHQPDRAFTDGRARAEGIRGQIGTRNTPSLHNATYTDAKFWDGRRPNLTEQVLDPFTNPREQGLTDHAELLRRFQAAQNYTMPFQAAFERPLAQATGADLAKALGVYVRHLKPQHTNLERFILDRNKAGFSEAEQRGLELFRGRARCAECHQLDAHTATLTDGNYHTRGVGLSQIASRLARLTKAVASMTLADREHAIGADLDVAALGRFTVTLRPADLGKFKTPSLYDVAVTSPYMHDGSLATLEAAVDWELYYQDQGSSQPIVLSQSERANLLSFLRALTTTPRTGPSS